MTTIDSGAGTSGKYRRITELGHGGMAEVFLALASGPAAIHKLVVLKQISSRLIDNPDVFAMFLDEARLVARLSHPNVIQTHEAGRDGNAHFMCMEYLEGQTLNRILSRLDRAAGLSLVMQLKVLAEMLSGLHYAHELTDFDGTPLAVVHRDVSPSNVFVTYDGHVKVIDFGIAKVGGASHVTHTGMVTGKISYMAPEQARGEGVDRRADIFAAGVILWEMLTGRRMFKGLSLMTAFKRIAAAEIPRPREIEPSVPARLDAICQRALAHRREDRYATAADLRHDIEEVLAPIDSGGALRDLGKLLECHFEAEREQIKALVRAHFAAVAGEPARRSSRRRGALPAKPGDGGTSVSVAAPAEARPATEPPSTIAQRSPAEAASGDEPRAARGMRRLASAAVLCVALVSLTYWAWARAASATAPRAHAPPAGADRRGEHPRIF